MAREFRPKSLKSRNNLSIVFDCPGRQVSGLEHLLNPAVLAELQTPHSVSLEHPMTSKLFFHLLNHALGREGLVAAKAFEGFFFI